MAWGLPPTHTPELRFQPGDGLPIFATTEPLGRSLILHVSHSLQAALGTFPLPVM